MKNQQEIPPIDSWTPACYEGVKTVFVLLKMLLKMTTLSGISQTHLFRISSSHFCFVLLFSLLRNFGLFFSLLIFLLHIYSSLYICMYLFTF